MVNGCQFTMQELSSLARMQDMSQALALYTERHYRRLDRLLQSTFVLDFLLQGLQVYAADEPAGSGGPTGAAVYTAGIALPERLQAATAREQQKQNAQDAQHDTVNDAGGIDVLEPVANPLEQLVAVERQPSAPEDGTAADAALPGWGSLSPDGSGQDELSPSKDASGIANAMPEGNIQSPGDTDASSDEQQRLSQSVPGHDREAGSSGSNDDASPHGLGVLAPPQPSNEGYAHSKQKRHKHSKKHAIKNGVAVSGMNTASTKSSKKKRKQLGADEIDGRSKSKNRVSKKRRQSAEQ
jgi:Utp13 specific WD40 associated domain